MTPWAIEDGKLIFVGTPHDSNIQNINTSSKLKQIEVILCNGQKFGLHLADYEKNERDGLPGSCRYSRTLFINWLKENKEELVEKEQTITSLKEQVNTAEDVANRARREIKESNKKRPGTCPENHVENQPMQKRVRVNTQIDCEKQMREDDTTISTSSDKNLEENTLAVVEYKNGSFYLGLLVEKSDSNEFTYCKSPVAKETNGDIRFMETINSRKLNMKDVQTIDSIYVIYKFSGQVVNNTIVNNPVIQKKIHTEVKKHISHGASASEQL